MCGENIKTNCGSSSDKSRINEYMSDQKARSLRRAVLLHQQLWPGKKGYFARHVTIRISSNLDSICLWVPSMCGENRKTNCGSSSDKSRINEYMSDKKASSLRRALLLHQRLWPEKKGTLLEM